MIFKLRTAVYPPRMAPIGSKLCQNAFQVIPDVSFFDAGNNKKSKKMRTLKVRLPREDGSDWPETWPKSVSGDPEISLFDVEDRKIFGFFGRDHFVVARTHVSWATTHVSWGLGPRHMCPHHETCV